MECDAAEAVKLYSRSIDYQKDVVAMNNLKHLFQNGAEGVERDFS